MLEQADRLADEARRLSGDPDMPWPHALEYLAARGNKEAQGFLDALAYEHAKPLERGHRRRGNVR